MATVSIEQYEKTLKEVDKSCSDGVAALINAYATEHPGLTTEDLREYAISVATEALSIYSGAATYAADALFDDMMAAEGVDASSALGLYSPDVSKIGRVIHYQVGKCASTHEFAKQVGKATAYYARESANKECMAQVERVRRHGSRGDIRFARIPQRAVPCPWCVMLASRGFDYKSSDSAAAGKHRNCTCLVVPGIKGSTKVDGYDVEMYERVYQRLHGERVVHEGFYDLSPEEVKDQAQEINTHLKSLKGEYDRGIKDSFHYRDVYAGYIKEIAGERASIEDFTFIEGKELQLTSWFTEAGHVIAIRNADDHEHNKSDVWMDGEIWEFKRVESKRISKLTDRIITKLSTQGPNFVVDISASTMSIEHAKTKICQLLEDPRIEKIMLVAKGKVTLFEK